MKVWCPKCDQGQPVARLSDLVNRPGAMVPAAVCTARLLCGHARTIITTWRQVNEFQSRAAAMT